MEKKKIAVLGGGTGSLSTVWALTTLPDWDERWDITVYQVGWRLGGKGASGRNPQYHQRIEEHGLHVWAGFYDNAFRVMRQVYEAWDPGPDAEIKTWRDAFKPQSDVVMEEFIDGKWVHWPIEWPPAPGEPGGDGDDPPDVWGYLLKFLDWIVDAFGNSPLYPDLAAARGGEPALWRALTGGDDDDSVTPETPEKRGLIPDLLEKLAPVHLVQAARDFSKWLQPDPKEHFRADHMAIIKMLEQALDTLRGEFGEELDSRDDARRLYYILDMGLGTIKGLILDGVIFRGWDAIDIWEWREWMSRWGVSDYTLKGVAVRGLYDYIFGFPNGDFDNPRVGAGTAIHGAFRLVFTYKEALFFYMQAGMGDIVFSPLYLELRERGVKFKFFHKVENLGLNANKDTIETISIQRQVDLKSGDPASYEGVEEIKGVWSWPSAPFYDQIVQGEELKNNHINLESNWADWSGVENLTLQRGVDFDEVILGIPPTSYRYIAPELLAANDRFARMTYGIKSSATQAVQLWIDKDAAGIGAPSEPVVATAYVDPINTWADMSHLIQRETWGTDDAPKFVAYFCGPMTDAANIPDFSDHGFPERELERCKQMAKEWFESNTGHIFEKAGMQSNPAALDLTLLHGTGTGEEKFMQQYFRVNIDPSERYMLSVPGSTAVRLKAHESGFGNLFLTGDWTYTSISAGCIECAVMSGLHCAEAVSGDAFEITDRAKGYGPPKK